MIIQDQTVASTAPCKFASCPFRIKKLKPGFFFDGLKNFQAINTNFVHRFGIIHYLDAIGVDLVCT
jgi:hypothetical protein